MSNCVARYENALKKRLTCKGSIKKELIDKFRKSLADYLEDCPTPEMADLCNAFGPPEEMAKVLMEEVSAEEVARHRRWKTCLRVAVGLLTASLLLFAIYVFFCKQKPITYYEEVSEFDTASTEPTTNE